MKSEEEIREHIENMNLFSDYLKPNNLRLSMDADYWAGFLNALHLVIDDVDEYENDEDGEN
jgi:hypothetical protein